MPPVPAPIPLHTVFAKSNFSTELRNIQPAKYKRFTVFYELCEQVWGGSPATEQTDAGIETVDLENALDQSTTKDSTTTTTTSSETEQDNKDQGDAEPVHVPPDTIVKQ